jgi:formyl-CoA transferase
MLDGQISLLSFQAGICFAEGRPPRRHGNAHPTICPYETLRASDGYLNIGVGNDHLWKSFCSLLGAEDLAIPSSAAAARETSNSPSS